MHENVFFNITKYEKVPYILFFKYYYYFFFKEVEFVICDYISAILHYGNISTKDFSNIYKL